MLAKKIVLALVIISLLPVLPILAGDKTYEAIKVKPIKVDGDISDWPVNVVWDELKVLGAFVQPTGPDDLTAKFAVTYSTEENRIYIAAKITDDATFAVKPIEDGGAWENDRLEIYIDGDNSKKDTAYKYETAQQYAVYGPAEKNVKFNGGERAVLNYKAPYTDDDFLASVKRTGTLTVYEISLIVYKTFKKDVLTLAPGVKIGYDMAIVDNDDGNNAATGTFFFWSEGGGKFQDETKFGTLILSATAAAVNSNGKLTSTWGSLKK